MRLPRSAWGILEAACKEAGVGLGTLIAGLVLRVLGEDGGDEDETSDEEDPAPAPRRVEVRQDPRLTPEQEAAVLAQYRQEGFWSRVAQDPPFGVRLTRDHKGRLRPAPEVEKLG